MSVPLDATRRAEVRARTQQYIELAGCLYERNFPVPSVRFDLSGLSAGMLVLRHGSACIRYNPWIFDRHYDESLASTVPHEVAHYIVHALHPRRRVKPHGPEWRAVMNRFGVVPEVTFDLDLEGLPRRRQRRHAYACGCDTQHQLSTTRHRRVQRRQARYCCRRCGDELVHVASPE